ncbi:WD40 repeat domain-containing protein [Zavarzinella formosa]|uniref:WD40 repeat domain-containing protein n=1 Tax=Zavarzinella formosa TaxID=360055 RepID=UPI0002FE0D38|nr:WD40 repeat domain-containing protein [Zavarzinella formosa]
MNTWGFRRIAATVAVFSFLGTSAAESAKPFAVLKGAPGKVGSIAFSYDGTRLVVAGGDIAIWDVPGQRKVLILDGTEQNTRATYGGRYAFSADGLKLYEWSGRGIHVSDVKTGLDLLKVPKARVGSNYTVSVMSPDGAYVAVALNEWSGKSKGTLRSYTAGIVSLYDVKTSAVKWVIAGENEETEALSTGQSSLGARPRDLTKGVHWLRFSPDGKQLLVVGQSMRIFSVDAAKEVITPSAAIPIIPDAGKLEWTSDGKGFNYFNEGVGAYDLASGKRKILFAPKDPQPPIPKPVGKQLPLPPELQPSWTLEMQLLSGDGTRLLHYGTMMDDRAKVRHNRVVVWDVPGKKLIGVFPLPDEPFDNGKPKPDKRPATMTFNDLENDLIIALSRDGRQLAVGDTVGVVRIYDVSHALGAASPDATDPLAVGSFWKGEKHRNETNKTMSASLKITERKGSSFKGEFKYDGAHVCEVEGKLTDGKIEFNTTKVLKGNAHQPTSGSLDGNSIKAKFDVTVKSNGKSYTATGTVKLTKSE